VFDEFIAKGGELAMRVLGGVDFWGSVDFEIFFGLSFS
jgi:hypothetical protein